jgi:hypothetical protein
MLLGVSKRLSIMRFSESRMYIRWYVDLLWLFVWVQLKKKGSRAPSNSIRIRPVTLLNASDIGYRTLQVQQVLKRLHEASNGLSMTCYHHIAVKTAGRDVGHITRTFCCGSRPVRLIRTGAGSFAQPVIVRCRAPTQILLPA